jgi:hypothetical protein
VDRLELREVLDAGVVGIAADRSCDADEVHGHEDAVGAGESDPEVQLAERLAHEAAKHFRIPEIGGAEDTENCGYAHD